jgi:hypothetical protein
MIKDFMQAKMTETATSAVAVAGVGTVALPKTWWDGVTSVALEATPLLGALWLAIQIYYKIKNERKSKGERDD